jgi:hypothetical protein
VLDECIRESGISVYESGASRAGQNRIYIHCK